MSRIWSTFQRCFCSVNLIVWSVMRIWNANIIKIFNKYLWNTLSKNIWTIIQRCLCLAHLIVWSGVHCNNWERQIQGKEKTFKSAFLLDLDRKNYHEKQTIQMTCLAPFWGYWYCLQCMWCLKQVVLDLLVKLIPNIFKICLRGCSFITNFIATLHFLKENERNRF